MTEAKKPVGRPRKQQPQKVKVEALASCNYDHMMYKGDQADIPVEVARVWQDKGIVKIVI